MESLLTALRRQDCERVGQFLRLHQVPAEWRPTRQGQSGREGRYDLFVPASDVERSRVIVSTLADEKGLIEDVGEVLAKEEVEQAPSIVACPRCGARRVGYSDALSPMALVAFVVISMPFAGIPLVVWYAYTRVKGSRNVCGECRHVWRSRP